MFDTIVRKIDYLINAESTIAEKDQLIEKLTTQAADVVSERDAEKQRADDLQAEKDLLFEKLAHIDVHELMPVPAPKPEPKQMEMEEA